jgi:molecular chaperone DnaK (HSP70)
MSILQDLIKSIKTDECNLLIYSNLDTIVAEGAGLYGGILLNLFNNDNNDIILLDILPLSLGIELADGSYSIIIPKDTPLPIKKSQKYTTVNNENTINIKVYQGERKVANKNYLIGEILFDNITSNIIEINFKADLNSIITITIIDINSGYEKNVIMKDVDQKAKLSGVPIINIKDDINISEVDNIELNKLQLIYNIKNHIVNSLINLKQNDLIDIDDKTIMLEKFKSIENELDNMISKMLKYGYNCFFPFNETETDNSENIMKSKISNLEINIVDKLDSLELCLNKLIGISSNSSKKGNLGENILEELFSNRYGDIQFIRKNDIPHSGDAWLILPNNKYIQHTPHITHHNTIKIKN